MQLYVLLGFFFSEVLNLNKFLRIVFIFCASWAILIRQNSLQNYNKDEKKKRKKLVQNFLTRMSIKQIKILNTCTVACMTRVTRMARTGARMARWLADFADPFNGRYSHGIDRRV